MKKYNSGGWTTARFNSFIKGGLRSISQRWPPRFKVLNAACVGTKVNKKTGRFAKHYKCACCGHEFPAKDVVVDHIESVVPLTGFTTWDVVIERMFCEAEGLQILCKPCHTGIKSKEEKDIRKSFSALRKDYEKEYQSWSNMNDRCYNPNSTSYHYYGGRGITVCDDWLRDGTSDPFSRFLGDMGKRPDGKSLDRVDFNKGYSKENCRWADYQEQARNTSFNNWIEYNGELRILQEWGELLNIKPNSILTRLRRGWSIAQALEKEERPKQIYAGRLTEQDINFIRESVEAGLSQTEIGRKLDIDSSQISRICSKFGI